MQIELPSEMATKRITKTILFSIERNTETAILYCLMKVRKWTLLYLCTAQGNYVTSCVWNLLTPKHTKSIQFNWRPGGLCYFSPFTRQTHTFYSEENEHLFLIFGVWDDPILFQMLCRINSFLIFWNFSGQNDTVVVHRPGEDENNLGGVGKL